MIYLYLFGTCFHFIYVFMIIGKVIQETQAAETFRQFVMTVGVEQVQSLNIKVCKIPLISNTLHEKYQRAQKP